MMAKLQLATILKDLARHVNCYDTASDTVQYRKLSKEIKDAVKETNSTESNNTADERGPHPETLKKLIEGDDCQLSKSNFEAIHTCLRKHNRRGLDTVRIFELDGLLRSLVETERMTFFLPPIVQPVPEVEGGYREYVSSWDFRAFCSITDNVYQQQSDLHIDFQTETLRHPDDDPRTIDWGRLLEGGSRTYCSVASPLVSGLTSYMLGKMFNVDDPFDKVPPAAPVLPFYFSWYPKEDLSNRPSYPSAFALSPNDLRSTSNDLLDAIREKHAQAFRFGQEVYPVWLKRDPHDQYGVIVAQRRGPQTIWLVVAGLSGPGTFACAEKLPEIALALPDFSEGEVSRVLYAVVKSEVAKDQNKPFGDSRKVRNAEFVKPTPKTWP